LADDLYNHLSPIKWICLYAIFNDVLLWSVTTVISFLFFENVIPDAINIIQWWAYSDKKAVYRRIAHMMSIFENECKKWNNMWSCLKNTAEPFVWIWKLDFDEQRTRQDLSIKTTLFKRRLIKFDLLGYEEAWDCEIKSGLFSIEEKVVDCWQRLHHLKRMDSY